MTEEPNPNLIEDIAKRIIELSSKEDLEKAKSWLRKQDGSFPYSVLYWLDEHAPDADYLTLGEAFVSKEVPANLFGIDVVVDLTVRLDKKGELDSVMGFITAGRPGKLRRWMKGEKKK